MIETIVDERFVATVTVNNPGQRNSLGNAGKRALAEALERVSATAGLRVVILTGAGYQSFIGGANLKEMAGFVRDHASEGPALTHRVCEAIRRTPVPVIARINGWCLGAGLEIAASCDMRAAADTARFGMPEVLFGLPSGMEACLLPQLIGWGKTRELVFTGRHIGSAEAMDCHLIERVATPEKLDEAIEDWVSAILKAGPNAVRAQKELIRDWERMAIADAVQQGIRAVAAAHGTDEAKRLMEAFVQRRQTGAVSTVSTG
jgi:enoyl-CoA hydratase